MGSEFTAMKNTVEIIYALRYNLRMFGVLINGPTNIFCDNGAVCVNMMRTKSTLSKKYCIIAYHRTREGSATRTVSLSMDNTATNLANLFTKTMAEPKREGILEKFTY